MMTPTSISDLAADIADARDHANVLDWPADQPADLAEAYAVALAARTARIAAGEVPAGYKVGFTNRTIWPIYGVYAPIWGTVWRSTLTHIESAAANEATISLANLCEPRIEPEIVFGLREAPPLDCNLQQLMASLDWVAHGFEIVHTHFAGWKFSAAQAVADGGLHGHLLIGHKVPLAGDQADLADALSGIRLALYCNGELKDEGHGANVLDGPLQALLYFVQALRSTPDAPTLRAGDVVTTGTLTDAHAVRSGEVWHTELQMPGGKNGMAIKGLRVTFT